jgi:hypothetical protein
MNNLEKEFVLYGEALELKQLGFDEPCLATIDQTDFVHIKGTEYPIRGAMVYFTVDCPTYSKALKWFRKKGYKFNIISDSPFAEEESHYIEIWFEKQFLHESHYIYKTYEDAELDLLKKLIQYEKEKQQ